MSKGQKRTSKETKKAKSETGQDKKKSGPKYLRESEAIQAGSLGMKGAGKRR